MASAACKAGDATNNSVCAECGAAFRCGAVGQDARCWCFELPHVVGLPPSSGGTIPNAAQDSGCLCPACLAQTIAQPKPEGI